MTHKPTPDDLLGRHRRVATWSALVVALMVGASFAAVPLYSYICRVTNFDGTPRRTTTPSPIVLDKTLTIRFDANVAPDLPWRFEPVEHTRTVRIGETNLAFYRATNLAKTALRGTATFNVFPEQSAAFFNKLACFCFKEQELGPGEGMEFPVSFFVDPNILKDRDAQGITDITLSYTFYPVRGPKPGLAEQGLAEQGLPSAPRLAQPQPTKGKAG
jgi:cytochrome c oxidase assembly protein subunit 11